jgi:hypothetical protein
VSHINTNHHLALYLCDPVAVPMRTDMAVPLGVEDKGPGLPVHEPPHLSALPRNQHLAFGQGLAALALLLIAGEKGHLLGARRDAAGGVEAQHGPPRALGFLPKRVERPQATVAVLPAVCVDGPTDERPVDVREQHTAAAAADTYGVG